MSLEGLDFASEASPQVTYSDCLILSVVDWRGTLTRLLDHKDCEIISEKNSVMNWKLNWTLVGIWSQKLPLFVCLFLLSSHHKEITFGWPCNFTTLSYHVINWRGIMSWDSWDHLHELTICPLCHFLLDILSWWQMIRNRLVQVGSILSMECKKKKNWYIGYCVTFNGI